MSMFDGRFTSQPRITSCKLTANDWQLYTVPGHTKAARTLNNELKVCVNQGGTKEDVRQMMYLIMDNLREFGAYDTEPRSVLESILDEIYGV